MQIVIIISEDDYKEVKEDTYSGTPFENRVFSAIANGTPLPKGHGRLIDADALEIGPRFNENGDLYGHIYYITEYELNNAPTIIESEEK